MHFFDILENCCDIGKLYIDDGFTVFTYRTIDELVVVVALTSSAYFPGRSSLATTTYTEKWTRARRTPKRFLWYLDHPSFIVRNHCCSMGDTKTNIYSKWTKWSWRRGIWLKGNWSCECVRCSGGGNSDGLVVVQIVMGYQKFEFRVLKCT